VSVKVAAPIDIPAFRRTPLYWDELQRIEVINALRRVGVDVDTLQLYPAAASALGLGRPGGELDDNSIPIRLSNRPCSALDPLHRARVPAADLVERAKPAHD